MKPSRVRYVIPLSTHQQPPCLRGSAPALRFHPGINDSLTLNGGVIQISYVLTAGKCQRFLSIPGRKPVLLKQETVRTRTGSGVKTTATSHPLYLTLAGSHVT